MAFPTTGILDDFNRANGGLGANWTEDVAGATHAISSNTVARSTGTSPWALWNATTFGPNCQAFVDLPTKPGNLSAAGVMLGYDLTNHNGYMVLVVAFSGTDEARIYRIDNSVATQIGSGIAREFTSGESIGAERVGSLITVYVKSGGTWSAIGSTTDATYTAAGYIGISVQSSAARVDNFGGGTIKSPPIFQKHTTYVWRKTA